MMTLNEAKHIYFLGIGGIGMSALARYFHRRGKRVSGYDRAHSVVTRDLEAEGMMVHYELAGHHLNEVDYLVYTPAIKADNLEYQEAVKRDIPIRKRSQVLGEISRDYRTLAVAGTHGKTTTSILLSHLLQQGGVDCTAFLGGISRNFASNFVLGTSEYLVAEADEFDRSFLTLSPWAAVITSLDPDHLDIYGTAGAMKESYREFAAKASQSLLLHSDLPVADWQLDHQTYGVEEGDFQAQGLRYHELSTWFDYQSPAQRIEGIRLPLPGQHNVANAVAAMALAEQAGADPATFKSSLEGFRGIYRRFEAQLHTARLTYIDDYAHHPREIQAAMETARKLFPNRKLLVVFQPHLYSRTRDFLPGFAQALAQADSLLMLDIYPAREAPIEGVTSQAVLDQVELKNKALVAKNELIEAIAQRVDDPTVLLSLGAGDIDRLVPHMKTWAESYALQFQ